MKFRFTPPVADESPHRFSPGAVALGAIVLSALVGCSTSNHPAGESTTSAASPSPTVASPGGSNPLHPVTPPPAAVHVDTLAIGTTGDRCFVGSNTFACVASTQQMTHGQTSFWTFIGSAEPPGALEPGFTPGELVSAPAVGDIAFVDASSCSAGGPVNTAPGQEETPMGCRTLNLIPMVRDTDSAVLVGVVAKVSATDLTIRVTGNELPPIPQPATPAKVYFRPGPGRPLNADQPVKAGAFTFTLHGSTLTIDGPHGPVDIGV